MPVPRQMRSRPSSCLSLHVASKSFHVRPRMLRSAQCAGLAERGDLVGRDIEQIQQHGIRIRAKARGGAGNPAEGAAPWEAGQNAVAMRIPKTTFVQMLVAG